MFDEHEFIIAVYCLICEYYQRLFPKGVRRGGFLPKLTDEEAITIAIVGEYLSLGNDTAIYRYFRQHYSSWFPDLSERSLLVRQWNKLWKVKERIWQAIVDDCSANLYNLQFIDTTPIPICHIRRAKQCRIFKGDSLCEVDYGYSPKCDYYFGVKGGLRITPFGMIIHAPLLPARPHDSSLTEALLLGVPAHTIVGADKGFINLDIQLALKEEYDILLKTPLRSNMKGREIFKLSEVGNRFRRLIETVIAQFTERFHIQRMKVRKGWTLLAKWYRKLLAHTVCVFLNLTHGRNPIDLEGLVRY